ncbi:MAG: SDR family NAD(P)-dependent oxidoreductase [Anaerolineales bacterium]|nr:SDR family NAD(P)-dependent oxidoreductase [Anaerolineales bacterium]
MPHRPPLVLADGLAVITGAAAGLGQATAEALARRGCHLALADRDAAGLAETARRAAAVGVPASVHVLDVADQAAAGALPEQVAAAHRRPVTVLLNNAGVALAGTFQEMALDDFRWVVEINFLAQVTLTKAFLPGLLRAGQAQIVNVSSIFGLIAPAAQTAYAASKFAVRGFSEALRHELEATPVGVTVVHPGGVRTNIALHARVAAGADPEQARRQAAAFTAQLRLTPAAAAAAIVRATERRAGRLLIGRDAQLLAALQSWLPVRYWAVIKRLFLRPDGSLRGEQA